MPVPDRPRPPRRTAGVSPALSPDSPPGSHLPPGGTTLAPWGVLSRVGDAPGGPSSSAMFVIDRSDTILAHQIAEDDRWLYGGGDLTGRSLRSVLLGMAPAWVGQLPGSLFESDETLHLPDIAPATPGLVLAVHRLRCGGQMHVTLVPELAPGEVLRQSGIADFVPDAATFAKLFLRLRAVENRLDHYLDHFPGVVYNQRADLSFAFIGPGCESLIGVEVQALSRDSQVLLRLIHPGDERSYYQELDRNASSSKPFSLVYRVLNPRAGTYLYLLDVRSPVRSATGLLLGYEGVWLDITRQKLAEHGMSTRVWRDSISTVTKSLLEEFSTAMTGVFSLSEIYHKNLSAKHPLRDGLELIKENAARAQVAVGKILELNREATGDRVYSDLANLVRGQVDLLQLIMPHGTQISATAPEVDLPVLVDETAFRQTLANLALNSRDALTGSGEIHLTVRRLAAGAEPLGQTVPPLAPVSQESVELVFSDNGSGIEAAHLPRIFEPFFSTKDGIRGAGLGLYHAKQFVESHGGTIAARSSVGRGTDIVLVMPLADLSVEEPSEATASEAMPVHQTHVLYYELGMTDEVTLLNELCLPEWEVRTVATPQAARRALQEDGRRLDLIIIRQARADSELRMLLAEIRRDHPGLPIALALTFQRAAELPTSLRSQVDLLLPAGIRDLDAADSLAKLLRTP